ncbi:MAG: hypothetical protein WCK90_02910 [archaeon]
MVNSQTKRIAEEMGQLYDQMDVLSSFKRAYGVTNTKEGSAIVDRLRMFTFSIPDTEKPETTDQLLQSELRRLAEGASIGLEQYLGGKFLSFEEITRKLMIPQEDLDNLEPWLKANKEGAIDAMNRLYKSFEANGVLRSTDFNAPSIAKKAEEMASMAIDKYHRVIGKFLEGKTKTGSFVKDIPVYPTHVGRSSFFEPFGLEGVGRVAIGIPAICGEDEKGAMKIHDSELIRLYGHECMGHALNYLMTKRSDLPRVLKRSANISLPTMESVAQFYEEQIMEDLKANPNLQEELDLVDSFDKFYENWKDSKLVREFQIKDAQYARTVIADSKYGNPSDPKTMDKKRAVLSAVAIDPTGILHLLEGTKSNFDSRGNPAYSFVEELIYCARPVDRALKEFASHGIRYDQSGRDLIDKTFLTGYWTPQGFVDNARLVAEENSQENRGRKKSIFESK